MGNPLLGIQIPSYLPLLVSHGDPSRSLAGAGGPPIPAWTQTLAVLSSALGTWFINHRGTGCRLRVLCVSPVSWGQGAIQIPEILRRGEKTQTKS
jgi:hypothetical protein